MPSATDPLVGRVLGGRYRLVAPVGRGASAIVYLADDATLRRRVAVKVLQPALAADDAFLRRFRAEAHAAAALNHPHVMAVYDWGLDGVPYLVAEYLGGGSLRTLLDSGARLSPSQALLVGLEAARGLEYAHRKGIVHRDIKPANLLFDDEGRLRLADFGLARALAEHASTEQGAMLGTVRYAPPELGGAAPLGPKADVYSLAVVLVEAVTGEVPTVGETPFATLALRAERPLDVPSSLGPLRSSLARAGSPDPDDRPDASEFAIALMAAAELLPRPQPLPLVRPAVVGAVDDVVDDPTLLAPSTIRRADEPTLVVTPLPDGAGEAPPTRTTPASGAPLLPATAGASGAPGAGGPSGTSPRLLPADGAGADTRAHSPAVAPPAAGSAPAGAPASGVDAPRRRRRWPWVVLGLLVLAGALVGGWFAYDATRTKTYRLDDFTGRPVADLEAAAAKYQWSLDRKEQRDDTVAAGSIIGTDPPGGAKLQKGATVAYAVSIGRKTVAIPDLKGLTPTDAQAKLASVELTLGDQTKVYSEDVPAGKIVGSAEVVAEKPKGEAVAVKVSQGPEPRTVPDLSGKSLADASAAVTALKLTPQPGDDYSDTVPAGQVIRTSPAAGTKADVGTAVQIVVSKGPQPRPVPNVVGQPNAAAAAAKLREAGFVPGDVNGPADRPVLATDPPAGELRVPGTTVNIITRRT